MTTETVTPMSAEMVRVFGIVCAMHTAWLQHEKLNEAEPVDGDMFAHIEGMAAHLDTIRDAVPELRSALDAALASEARSSSSGEVALPLDTAPKDGGYFLIIGSNFDGGAAVVRWDEDFDNWTLDDGKNPEIVLRHEAKLIGWMPLPAAVAAALEGKDHSNAGSAQ